MTTNNHTLLSSLYANPLAAGTIPADLPVEAADHDRLVSYLLWSGTHDEPAIELAAVASAPTIPPRADIVFAPVVAIPTIPPRA